MGKRPDGYHDIETVFHRVDLFDEVSVKASSGVVVECSSPDAPKGKANICHTAVLLLQEYLHTSAGARIEITKNIPVGAGLGGGSSDAAAVLLTLPRLWSKEIPLPALQSLALQLGSDVPYFLNSGSAFASGRGEHLEYSPLDIPYTILICHPNIHVSTAWTYRNVVAPGLHQSDLRDAVLQGISDPRVLSRIENDLERVVFDKEPDVRRVKEEMMNNGALFALMSGSGSSVYGFFSQTSEAQTVGANLSKRGYRTFLTPPHFLPD